MSNFDIGLWMQKLFVYIQNKKDKEETILRQVQRGWGWEWGEGIGKRISKNTFNNALIKINTMYTSFKNSK